MPKHLPGQRPVNSSVRQSHHIKQGELIGLGNISEQPQIVHKINDCLTDLGAVTEIILGQEFSLLCSLHHRLRSLVSHSVNAVQRRKQLAVNDLEAVCMGTVNINRKKLEASGVHLLDDTHISDRILFLFDASSPFLRSSAR